MDRLPVRAGQFFQWRFLDGPGWSPAHPYSLSAAPHTGVLRISVKDLGDGSARVAALRPGTPHLSKADTASSPARPTPAARSRLDALGDVQVTITVVDGKLTGVPVPTYANSNGRDQEINARALPILTQETLAAQSADIDTVSGAAVTSNGYKDSLQAALDAAHLS